jgi:hypothetical protein
MFIYIVPNSSLVLVHRDVNLPMNISSKSKASLADNGWSSLDYSAELSRCEQASLSVFVILKLDCHN